ncbi:MAG: PilZ domain-containing protein [Methylotenera sp.]|nr:PilZ domain-containing protein [Oligoflexia bacterium]
MFEPIDFDTGIKSLREGIRTSSTAQLWTKNYTGDLICHLTGFDPVKKSFSLWRPGQMDGDEFKALVTKNGEKNCHFTISLAQVTLFFKAFFVDCDEIHAHFAVPDSFFKVQRRAHMRISIPNGYVLKVSFKNPIDVTETLHKKVIDISAGGAAIFVTGEEQVFFERGTILEDFGFTIKGKNLKCRAEVLHTRAVPDTFQKPGYRVGVRFLGLNAEDTAYVNDYVNSEARKYILGL